MRHGVADEARGAGENRFRPIVLLGPRAACFDLAYLSVGFRQRRIGRNSSYRWIFDIRKTLPASSTAIPLGEGKRASLPVPSSHPSPPYLGKVPLLNQWHDVNTDRSKEKLCLSI